MVLGESVVPPRRESGIKTASKRTRLPHKLRDRLIEVIEATIGRPLDPRSATQIDPRKSDPQPPNLYKWQFSDTYPEFLSRWHADQIHACYEALEQGHLIVVNVDSESSEARQIADNESAETSAHDSSSITRVTETPSINGSASSCRATVDKNSSQSETRETHGRGDSIPGPGSVVPQSGQVSRSTVPLRGLDDLQAQMLGMLNTALKSQAEELEITWKGRHESELTKLREKVAEAEEKLQKECASHRESLNSLLAMQRDGEKQRSRIAQLDRELRDKATSSRSEDEKMRARVTQLERELSDKVSLARSEGRQSMSDEILKDLDRTMEGERLALRRHHVEQLSNVRAESYQLGLQAGRSEAANSDVIRLNVDQTAEIEGLKRQHLKELKSARIAGRELAYTELSLGPDERVNLLLQNHVDLSSNRKIRELKTIHQNWHDIPQRILPSHMLPEGHTPGDKTLYLLARLSKEVDAATASRLLSEEIDERCKQNPNTLTNNSITNADIRGVLHRINPSSLGGLPASQKSAKLSQQSPSHPQGKPGESHPVEESSRSRTSVGLITSNEFEERPIEQRHSNNSSKALPTANMSDALQISREMIGQTGETNSTTPNRRANILRATALTLNDYIKGLPPITVRLPYPLQSFSVSFLREKIGGGEFAFSKVGASMLKKQIIPWPEVIRIIPEHQKFAPKLGRHGALAFVEGRPGCGDVGKTYATVFRQNKERFLYIGHYTLCSKETVSLEEWKTWSEEEKLVIAREIRDTNWGETLLTEKCLKSPEELAQISLKKHLDEILKLFDRESEPNLRMTWSILRFDEFKIKDYEVLRSARTNAEPPKNLQKEDEGEADTGRTLEDYFKEAVQQFLDGKNAPKLNFSSSSDFTAARTSRKIVGKTVEQVREICIANPDDSLFFGIHYGSLTQKIRTFGTAARLFPGLSETSSWNRKPDSKRHIIDWTREILAGRLQNTGHVIFALHVVLMIFNEQKVQILRDTSDRRASAPSTTRNTLTASTRPLLGPRGYQPEYDDSDSDEILFNKRKRRKTTSFTALPSRTQHNQRAAGTVQQPSVEIIERSSTIFVDLGAGKKASPAVKKDHESLKEDLYDASPPPGARKRVHSKRASGV
ncbi:hypothetical protein ONS95_003391 [Cadophora gregata]|uniref:uncharacterized protein n=2 Tax=Cadophora gregata TaxID=51156 RepID=UPI0026DA91A3|nr:uncharacterized protein ONS95_003391 [Cadophora gregata]KAK0108594.1 hypothetical protein ONS95_003391 [Cadophora gregata]